MSELAEKLIEQALNPSPDERAGIAERPLAGPEPESSKIDLLWAQEAGNRLDAYERGKIKVIPAEQVFSSIKDRKR